MSADTHIMIVNEARLPISLVKEYLQDDFLIGDDSFARYQDTQDIVTDYKQWEFNFLDSVWVGQVSWMKAAYTEDEGRSEFIPRAVERIHNIYAERGGVVRITPELIPLITLAFNLPHDSFYEKPEYYDGVWHKRRGIAKARTVKNFLLRNMGRNSFLMDQ